MSQKALAVVIATSLFSACSTPTPESTSITQKSVKNGETVYTEDGKVSYFSNNQYVYTNGRNQVTKNRWVSGGSTSCGNTNNCSVSRAVKTEHGDSKGLKTAYENQRVQVKKAPLKTRQVQKPVQKVKPTIPKSPVVQSTPQSFVEKPVQAIEPPALAEKQCVPNESKLKELQAKLDSNKNLSRNDVLVMCTKKNIARKPKYACDSDEGEHYSRAVCSQEFGGCSSRIFANVLGALWHDEEELIEDIVTPCVKVEEDVKGHSYKIPAPLFNKGILKIGESAFKEIKRKRGNDLAIKLLEYPTKNPYKNVSQDDLLRHTGKCMNAVIDQCSDLMYEWEEGDSSIQSCRKEMGSTLSKEEIEKIEMEMLKYSCK